MSGLGLYMGKVMWHCPERRGHIVPNNALKNKHTMPRNKHNLNSAEDDATTSSSAVQNAWLRTTNLDTDSWRSAMVVDQHSALNSVRIV